MAKNVGLYSTPRNAACDAIVDLIDADGNMGRLKIYDTIDTTLLAEIHLGNPSFGASTAGVATGNSVSANETSAVNTGTAAEFVIESQAGTRILSGTVGVGSDFDLNFNTVSINQGDAVNINTMTVTVPETSATL